MRKLIFFFLGMTAATSFCQQITTSATWNPADEKIPVIGGQAWPGEVKKRYDRFPARAEKLVTKDVWELSQNSAGLYIDFTTDAPAVTVKYQVTGTLSFPHMPATGVSGTDLYGKDGSGKWVWYPGRYSFGDTVSYRFSNLSPGKDTTKKTFFRLYLPLYNTVKWMEFSYPVGAFFKAVPVKKEKPIIVYGTSIAQGGCAGRTGVAWPSILERNLGVPVINLGFSGNGHLDTSVLDLMGELDAGMYFLDCLPNLIEQDEYSDSEVNARLWNAVSMLQGKRPGVPIILSEHSAGFAGSRVHLPADNAYEHTNNVLRMAFRKMKEEGIKDIYLLSNGEIGFTLYSTVDGEHPNDLGMEQNALAAERKVREVWKAVGR